MSHDGAAELHPQGKQLPDRADLRTWSGHHRSDVRSLSPPAMDAKLRKLLLDFQRLDLLSVASMSHLELETHRRTLAGGCCVSQCAVHACPMLEGFGPIVLVNGLLCLFGCLRYVMVKRQMANALIRKRRQRNCLETTVFYLTAALSVLLKHFVGNGWTG